MSASRWMTNVALAPRTTLGLGGTAARLLEAHSDDDVSDALREISESGDKLFVLGGGSNLVVADAGYDGSVLAIRTRGLEIVDAPDHALVRAKAGEPWDDFVAAMCERGLSGVECLSGIPGLVGATPIQNVGAYGQEVSSTITRVRAVDRATLSERWIDAAECAFSYRDSAFKRAPGERVVLEVEFRLSKSAAVIPPYAELTRALSASAAPTLREIRDTVIALRKAKGMVVDASDPDSRSAGSFFLNPIVPTPVADEIEQRARNNGVITEAEKMPRFPAEPGFAKVPAAWLIERAGVKKGTCRGNVGVSSKHTLALVHHGGGTTTELLALANEIRQTVKARFGVELEQEPVILS